MALVKFVVLTSSRTGSTWLIDLLNKQPGVDAHGELFLDEPRSGPPIASRADIPRFVEQQDWQGSSRPPTVFSYLNRLYEPARTVGFKLMYGQLRRHPEILAFLAFRRVRIVHLVRKNHLDVIVSEELAKLTGASHVPAGLKFDAPKVYLEPTTLAERMRRRNQRPRQARWLVRLSTCPHMEVAYESLLESDQEFNRIAAFIGISAVAAHAKSNLAKRGSPSHRDSISNYDEVRRALGATSFSGMLR
jgi:LPS sulfotransferase NodH